MAVSKRLRFEVLRRDNHACRYCGAAAPEVTLTVDHVVPVALGGSDDPSNLVAACRECNGGKSSVPADAAIVQDVASDALRWAKAMEMVAEERAAERLKATERHQLFLTKWNEWTYMYRGERTTVELPGNWRSSVDQFLTAGLEMADLHELIDVAMGARSNEVWRYFFGCCWRRIKDSQERAEEMLRTADTQPVVTLSTQWTEDEIAEAQLKALQFADSYLDEDSIASVTCRHTGPCGDPVCRVERATRLEWLAHEAREIWQRDYLRDTAVITEAEALLDG